MKHIFSAAVIFALGVLPLAAQTFTAQNDVTVVPVASGFAVQSDAGIGARGMWCAAADYAQQIKGAKNAQRIYVVEARERGFGQLGPVTFGLTPTDVARGSVNIVGLSIANVGANLSVGHAIGFCADTKLLRTGS